MSDLQLRTYTIANYNIYVSSNIYDSYIEIDVEINPIGNIHFGIKKGTVDFLNMYTPLQLVEMLTNKEVMQKISEIEEIASSFELLVKTVNSLRV